MFKMSGPKQAILQKALVLSQRVLITLICQNGQPENYSVISWIPSSRLLMSQAGWSLELFYWTRFHLNISSNKIACTFLAQKHCLYQAHPRCRQWNPDSALCLSTTYTLCSCHDGLYLTALRYCMLLVFF